MATKTITIIGFGSLLSPTSAKTTFPELRNFKLAKVKGFRRIFTHPASIFFERGIANMETLEISSLCAEPCHGAEFICSVFEAEDIGMERFKEREEEFDLVMSEYVELDTGITRIRISL